MLPWVDGKEPDLCIIEFDIFLDYLTNPCYDQHPCCLQVSQEFTGLKEALRSLSRVHAPEKGRPMTKNDADSVMRDLQHLGVGSQSATGRIVQPLPEGGSKDWSGCDAAVVR